MALSLVAVGQKITAALWNTSIAAINSNGLTSIIPTSVVGAGATLGTNGIVTFVGASTISVNGCFSAQFDNYLIQMDVTTKSTTGLIQARLRLAGTDASGATDYAAETQITTGAVVSSAASTASLFALTVVSSANEDQVVVTIAAPGAARPTRLTSTSTSTISPTSLGTGLVSARHALSIAYDGIDFFPSAGLIYGNVRIYGYNNN